MCSQKNIETAIFMCAFKHLFMYYVPWNMQFYIHWMRILSVH